MKWLICPGLPRAGTTYLFGNLARPENAHRFNIPTLKETNRLFLDDPDAPVAFDSFHPERYSLDFSPGYSLSPGLFWQQVRDLPVDGSVKFIVTIRHPVAQAFAHYVHDISRHIAYERRLHLHFPFFGDAAMRRYFIDRSALFEAMLARFGPHNVLFLNFHTMFARLDETERRLAAFLELDRLCFDPVPIGSGVGMPFLLYGRRWGDSVLVGSTLYRAQGRALLMVNGEYSWIEHHVDATEAATLQAGTLSWQRDLPESVVADLEHHVFAHALMTYSRLIEDSLEAYRPAKLITRSATLPDELAFHGSRDALIEQYIRGRDYAAMATEVGYIGTPGF